MGASFLKYSKLLLFICFLLGNLSVSSQKILNKGKDITEHNRFKYTKTNTEFGKITLQSKLDGENDVLVIETLVRPKFIYKATASIPLKQQDLEKGQKVLVSFKGKTVRSGLETGEARFLWVLNQTGDYKGNINSTISLSKEWKQYYIPFEITEDVKKKDLRMALHLPHPNERLFPLYSR